MRSIDRIGIVRRRVTMDNSIINQRAARIVAVGSSGSPTHSTRNELVL